MTGDVEPRVAAGTEEAPASASGAAVAASVTPPVAEAVYGDDVLTLPRRLLAALEEAAPESLLGRLERSERRRYRDALALRESLLVEPLGALHGLPRAERDLHRRFGDAARAVAMLRDAPPGRGGTDERAALERRVARLRERGIDASRARLALCGALTAALLEELLTRAAVGASGDAAEPPTTLLSELLDLSDTLALDTGAATLCCADDYARNGRAWRARRLLRARLRMAPEESATSRAYALSLAARAGRRDAGRERAREALTRAIALAPGDVALAAAQARLLAAEGRAHEAVRELDRIDAGEGGDGRRREGERARFAELARTLDAAEPATAMPSLAPDAAERRAGRFDAASLAVAARLYARYGTLRLDGVFDPALLGACREHFLRGYARYFGAGRHADALSIGDRRLQISLVLEGPFCDPAFYANPFVLGLMRRLLDEQAIIGSTVVAASLPGAKDQHLHKDHRAPFTRDADDAPPEWLPPVAITVMIPLIALDEHVGTTCVRKGSHRLAREPSARLPEQAPTVPLGSCFLMDLALSHRGLGNRSDRVRPIVNMQYQRRWFVDNKNFRRQRPLEIAPADFARVPKRHRRLFDWATQPGPKVNR